MADWIDACGAEDVDAEDVIGFESAGRSFAIYRSPDDEYFCTDGLCTHEQVRLCDGLVMDHLIECPKHNGQFDYRTGAAMRHHTRTAAMSVSLRRGQRCYRPAITIS